MIGLAEVLLILVILSIIYALPFILALIDILKSQFSGNDKIIWLLLIIFLPFIGSILYFLIGTKQKIKQV